MLYFINVLSKIIHPNGINNFKKIANMKNLNEYIDESYSRPYRIWIMTKSGNVEATLTLSDPRQAVVVDKLIEDELDNIFYHAEGGPNNIEL